MLIADMIHSCSNASVAEAAVSCIGGNFAERVAAVAVKNGMNVGRFVAIIVRDFGRRANDEALQRCARKSPAPTNRCCMVLFRSSSRSSTTARLFSMRGRSTFQAAFRGGNALRQPIPTSLAAFLRPGWPHGLHASLRNRERLF